MGLRAVAVWGVLVVLGCGVGVSRGGAQLRARPLAYPGVDAQGGVTTMQAALRTMAEQADVVFLGTVTDVTRVESDVAGQWSVSGGAVEVTFRVEQAVRGVSGASYTVREWGGLWPAGERRYAVGDRRLMLLHRPSAAGLSSPVSGMEGAIRVVGTASRVGEGSTGSATTLPVADLRWIAAKLVRSVTYAGTGSAGTTSRVVDRSGVGGEQGRALEEVGEGEGQPTVVHGVIRRPGSSAAAGGVATQLTVANGTAMPVADLLGLLQGWSPEERGAR